MNTVSKKKKVILFIVEGITDQIVFQEFFDQIVNKNHFVVKVVNGDIFTDKKYESLTPKAIIGLLMKMIRKQTKFTPNDIIFIAQLVDTDGIFIPESHYEVDENKDYKDRTYRYDLEQKKVYVQSSRHLLSLQDNWRKKKKLVLSLVKPITYSSVKIPYFIFYNSLNLEHVIVDEIVENKDKQIVALKFIETLSNNVQQFIQFFEDKICAETYQDSWNEELLSQNWYESKSNIKFLINQVLSLEK